MNTSTTRNATKQKGKNNKSKFSYNKPTLRKFGSIVSLTAGFGGSIADVSGPAGTPGHEP